MTIIDTVERIRELNLESKIASFLENSLQETGKKFRALEDALRPEINKVAESTGLAPTLSDYLACKYHIDLMSPQEVINYFRDELQIEIEGIDEYILRRWMKRLGIPFRSLSEAARVYRSKEGVYTDIGLTRRDFEILVYAARGYNPQETASLLRMDHQNVNNHRSKTFRKLGVTGKPLYSITQAVILSYESKLLSDERVTSFCGEVRFQEKLRKSINRFWVSPQLVYIISPLEAIVLYCAARGHSIKGTARLLRITHYTVYNYRHRLFTKFGVHDITQTVILGYELGWFDDKRFKHCARRGNKPNEITAHDVDFHPILARAMVERGLGDKLLKPEEHQ